MTILPRGSCPSSSSGDALSPLVAGSAVGVLVAVLVPVVSTLLRRTPTAIFAGTRLWMCLAVALFALGFGSVYPNDEERDLWGTETVVPSTLVVIPYAVVGGSVIGLLGRWYAPTGSLVGAALFSAGAASISFGRGHIVRVVSMRGATPPTRNAHPTCSLLSAATPSSETCGIRTVRPSWSTVRVHVPNRRSATVRCRSQSSSFHPGTRH